MKRRISVILIAICMAITAMTNAIVADEYVTVGNTYGDRDNCVFWGTFEGNIYEATSASGLPNGLYIVQYLGDGGFYVTGTVLPGTVGTHSVTISTSGQSQNYTIVVSKGSQTICLANNITSLSLHEDETYSLGAYSVDVSGNVIDVSSVDSSLVAEHQPTYTYTSSDTSVVTVSADGVVTGVGNGSATITISSAETGSYLAATPVTITVTSTAHTPTDSGTVTNPTCTEQGYTTYYCSTCESYYYRNYTEATGHTEAEAVIENEVDPTCTEAGSYESVVYCDDCGEELSRVTMTGDPATGHSYTATFNWASDLKSATVTLACSDCGHEETIDSQEVTITAVSRLGIITTTATVTYNGETYTSTQTSGRSLLTIGANYSSVREAIAKADALNPDDYEDFSAVRRAITNVNWTLSTVSQSAVNSMAEAINEAISNLVPVNSVTEEVVVEEPVEGTDLEIEE
ncbi:MAG: Ig-like domain-containing protein [Oscillospiraceae bacterium]|nr:Ig-like domain-containing protein [Oscillospiraceae bacterium]